MGGAGRAMCFVNVNQLDRVLRIQKSLNSAEAVGIPAASGILKTLIAQGREGTNANDVGDNLLFPVYIHTLSKHRSLQQLGCFKINHAVHLFSFPPLSLLNETMAENDIPSLPKPSRLVLLSGLAGVCVAINLHAFCCEASWSPALRA